MDIARHRGTRPSAKDRMEPPDRARRRRRPDEAHSNRENRPARRCYCSSSRERQRRPLAPGPQPRQNETAQASATLVGQHGVRWRLRTAHGLDSGADIICCGCTRTGRLLEGASFRQTGFVVSRGRVSAPRPLLWGGHSPSGWGVARTAQIIECAAARLSRRTAHLLLYLPPQIGRERAGTVSESTQERTALAETQHKSGALLVRLSRSVESRRRREAPGRSRRLITVAGYSTVTDFARLRG